MTETITTQRKPEMDPQHTQADDLKPSQDFIEYVKAYAREKPDVAALWCFGIGFVVGWKLKPW